MTDDEADLTIRLMEARSVATLLLGHAYNRILVEQTDVGLDEDEFFAICNPIADMFLNGGDPLELADVAYAMLHEVFDTKLRVRRSNLA